MKGLVNFKAYTVIPILWRGL